MLKGKKGEGIRSDDENDSSRYAELHTLCTRAISCLSEKGSNTLFIKELIAIRDEACDKTAKGKSLSAKELQCYHAEIEGIASAAELRSREQRGENIQDLVS